jgi:hypothetical protein
LTCPNGRYTDVRYGFNLQSWGICGPLVGY